MKEYFLDTNIILRFLLQDSKKLSPLSTKIFRAAESKKIKIWLTDVVVLELVWVLKSVYEYDRETIYESIGTLLALEFLECINKSLVILALNDYLNKNIDFADAHNYQLANKNNKKILSFDNDFKKLDKNLDYKKVIKNVI